MPRSDIYLDGIATQFKAADQPGKLADTPISVRLPVDIDRRVRQKTNRAVWLRKVIAAGLLLGWGDGKVTGKLADTPVSVRLPVDLDRRVRQKTNRTAWLRKVISTAVQEDKNPGG